MFKFLSGVLRLGKDTGSSERRSLRLCEGGVRLDKSGVRLGEGVHIGEGMHA